MWWVWLTIMAVALVVEFITTDLVSIWFVGGGLVALIMSFCGLDFIWYVEIISFIVVSAVLLLAFRNLVKKKFNSGEDKTNADSAIGKEYVLLKKIAFNEAGAIKVNGVEWTAVTENDGDVIEEGTIVKVKAIKGNKYIVEKKGE